MSAPERKPTKAVKAIGEISFTGDVIPPEWLRHVRTDSKTHRADPIGVLILARIVYWYRPKRVIDEDTQAVLRYERKFAGDKLQVNRRTWAEALGINPGQFDRSLNNLVRLGLVTKELRQLEVRGQSLNNVMFLEPVPAAIAAISQMPELTEEGELTEDEGDTPPSPVNERGSPVGETPSPVGETPSLESDDTYTETSTKTSTETSTTTTAADAGWDSFPDEEVPPPKKISRTKPQNTVYGFLVMKLTTKGGDKTRPPLIEELLDELPERAAWLDLPLERVKELHAKATRVHKETAAPFKNLFIKLLTDATHSAAKPTKPQKTQQELDDQAEADYQAQQRADAELKRRREEQNPSSPGAGGGGASGGR